MMQVKYFLFLILCSVFVMPSPTSIVDGGTGISSATAYAVLLGGTTNVGALQSATYVGTGSGLQALTSQGAIAPVFSPLKEFAYIYSRTASVVASDAAIPYELNGVMSSGITHSTSSNTDQIIINRAGTYLIEYEANASATILGLGLTIDGAAIFAGSRFVTSSAAGGNLCGQCIKTFTAGQVLRVVNGAASSMTLSSDRVASSITLVQIA